MDHEQGTPGQQPDAGTAGHQHHTTPAAPLSAAERATVDQFLAPLWALLERA